MTALRDRPSFLGRTAVAGVGYTPFSKWSGRSVQSLALEACRNAIEDCGLTPADVDGIVTYSLFNDSVAAQAVATGLALPGLTLAVDLSLGGQAPSLCVALAAMAVDSGVARNVLVFRALNGRSGVRIGQTRFDSPSSAYRYPIGFSAYPYYIAMWARRYMIETGATEEDLGAIVVQQRRNAAGNERAIQRAPLTLDDYYASTMLVDPFRVVDCTSEVDGACAVLVTSLEQARALRHRPVIIEGAAWETGHGSGMDIADMHTWPDLSRNCHSYLAPRLWASCGLEPSDMDFAEIYDCFSAVVLMGLEGLGLAGRGEAGGLVRSGATAFDGPLPVNTNGGLLNEGYVHGMNTVNEAVLQIQRRAEERQLTRAEVCVVTSGAMMDGSGLVLRGDV